jgi:hypothetical protein
MFPISHVVMAALVAAFHVFNFRRKTWMAGTRPPAGPAMTSIVESEH